MIQDIFEQEYEEQTDTGQYLFYRCTLKKDIGDYKCGQEIYAIFINFFDGDMEFHVEGGESAAAKFKLSLNFSP